MEDGLVTNWTINCLQGILNDIMVNLNGLMSIINDFLVIHGDLLAIIHSPLSRCTSRNGLVREQIQLMDKLQPQIQEILSTGNLVQIDLEIQSIGDIELFELAFQPNRNFDSN